MLKLSRRRLAGFFCAVAVVAMLAAPLGGCNTVRGIGRDFEAVAQGGQDMIDGKP